MLALRTRALGLERFLRLLGGGFTTDGQATMLARCAATPAILTHVVKAPQLAAFIGRTVATDVPRTRRTPDVHGCLGRLALAEDRHQGQRRGRAFFQSHRLAQRVHLHLRELLRMPAQQWLGQADVAIADALEPADLAALRFPQSTNFAVAAFLDQDAEPVMRIGTTDALDLVELGWAIFQRDPAGQALDDLVADHILAFRRSHAADVFAGDLETRVHHRVRQLAIGGEQQQAGGVDVQASDRDPACALQRWQRVEDGRPALGVFAGRDFAFGFVVHQHARRIGQRAGHEGAAVDLDLVAAGDAHAGARGFAVDLDQAVGDALFQRAARTQARLREHLVQAFLDARGFTLWRGITLQAQRAARALARFFLIAHRFSRVPTMPVRRRLQWVVGRKRCQGQFLIDRPQHRCHREKLSLTPFRCRY